MKQSLTYPSFLVLASVLFLFLFPSCQFLTISTNTAITANSGTASQSATVQLSWAASAGEPAGYKVEQSTDNVNFTQIQKITSGTTTTTQVTGLSWSKTYYFRIKAYNDSGDSVYSSTTAFVVVSQ